LAAPRAVLRLRDVVKTYPGVVALNGVTFEVTAGEVHALVGENGAGKSTLMAVAAGSTVPDRGTVEIGGRPMPQPSPAAAQALGLAVVYQQLSIIEDMTVMENMVFAMPEGRRPPMSRASGWTREQLEVVGSLTDPSARVTELSTADRQLLEIAKSLALESAVLVLDEPTESLTRDESERLFERIRAICEGGTAVVYISHRLPEVKGIADRITVLRDGETRGTFAAAEVSEDEILRLIIGRSVDQVFPEKLAAAGDAAPHLEVTGLAGGNFRGVDLTVAPGEIVGLAGIVGNGQGELIRALGGLERSTGEVRLGGRRIDVSSPPGARASGVVYLPGDRHREGLMLSLSVRENTSLLCLPELVRGGMVQRAREAELVAGQITALGVRTPSAETPVSSLSGGNQQKVLFARSLLAGPELLLADEPTRGVDAGARLELYQVLRRAAGSGMAVVVLSTDAIELQGLCDRVVVFSRGEIVRTLEGAEITEENITGAALASASHGRDEVAGRVRRLGRMRRFASGDYLPSVVLAVLILALGAYTSAENSHFLTAFNFQSMLLLAAALVFISFGQLTVVLAAGIDLSVGPLTGLVVVVLSFFVGAGQGSWQLVLGLLAVVGTALLVGGCNGLLIRGFRIPPVLATLAVYIAIQGVSLLLRPQPGGFYRSGVTSAIETNVGWVPLAFVVAAVLAVVLELVLRRTRAGLELRAVGSDETRAHRLGARVTATQLLAYAACSLFAAAGGLLLAAEVAVGDPSLGVEYTLTSITAVVLGGASIFGGRGSYIGAFLGAVLIEEIQTSPQFLQGTWLVQKVGFNSFSQWLLGIMILVGAGVYSRARGVRTVSLGR
jgi:ribose transport system permease protein/ribose transport system ATP-binding protein